jgi:hypothetical protein
MLAVLAITALVFIGAAFYGGLHVYIPPTVQEFGFFCVGVLLGAILMGLLNG